MNRVSALALIALGVFACGGCCNVPDAARPSNIGGDPTVAILEINEIREDGTVGTAHCTAWKIDQGILATAGHCCDLDEGSKGVFTLQGRHAPNGGEAKIIHYSYGSDDGKRRPDYCIMSGDLVGPSIRLADKEPEFGERVWTAGYPVPFTRSMPYMSEGFWTGHDEDGDGIASTVAIGGASGSPVMNSRGEAIGILWGGDRRSYSITLVTPLEYVRSGLLIAKAKMGRAI